MPGRTEEAEGESSTPKGRVLLRLCSDRVAYEARPVGRQRYDLTKVKDIVDQDGRYGMAVFTPYLIVLRRKGVELTMAQDGRLIIRKAGSETDAQAIAEELFSLFSDALENGT